ncbi:MAG: hypothetical protein KR126chlam6_00988, partial [Candidatus Anoxychlamydiales bacterium]|nr:hypothetical protein [Candidatus Anoxychlamydiales bacterium]
PNRVRLVETFLRGFPKQDFLAKLKKETPKWMDNQINSDLKDLDKITPLAIDATFDKIFKTVPEQKKSFIRYRVIDNKVYRYFSKDVEITKREPSFEKALKTLTKLTKLPNIDFIYSDMDGTPEEYTPKGFYITNEKEMQAPIFTRATIQNSPYVVLIPDYYSVSTKWEEDCQKILNQMKENPWEKKAALAFWRGGSHDKGYDIKSYKKRPRVVLAFLSKKYPQLIEAGINKTEYMQFLDVLEKDNVIKPFATVEDHLKYKFLPVLDGYMCTYPGYQWRLLSNSVCFKQKSNEVQWFYSALKPYEHYIPVANDMSDLVEKINWAKKEDQKCEKIAKNATDFILNNLMLEDVYLYLYKAIDSYSSHLKIDKNSLLKDTKSDPRWVCVQQRRKANKILLKMKNEN